MYLWFSLCTVYVLACQVRTMYFWWCLCTVYVLECQLRTMYFWWCLYTVYVLECQFRTMYLCWSLCTCIYSHAKWRGSTSGGVYVRVCTRMPSGEEVPLVECMYVYLLACLVERMYLWWSLCTVYVLACLMERMYLWWSVCCGGYVPCIFSHSIKEI